VRPDAKYDDEGKLSMDYCATTWRTFINAYRGFEKDARCTIVRYEDLVRDPEDSIRSLCTFLGLPYKRAMLDHPSEGLAGRQDTQYQRHKGLNKPIYDEKMRKWESSLSMAQIEAFERVGGREVRYLGYDLAMSSK